MTNPTRPLRVLVAEDEVINQQVLRKIFSVLGYDTYIAGTGMEAVEATNSDNFDLIFMDYQMPEMSGIEAALEIRKNERENSPFIVLMTSNALIQQDALYNDRLLDDYLPKPVSLQKIEELVNKWKPEIYRRQS